MEKQQVTKKKKFGPDAYVILFSVLILASILTYIIPAGTFDRQVTDAGISVIVPDSYKVIEKSPTGFFDIFVAIQTGLINISGMIFLVLIIGGTFAVIEKTGALDALILKTIQKTKNKEWLLIIIVVTLLSALGGLGIVSISVIALIPIGISLARQMKMDAIFGVAIMYLGAYSGFAIGFMDPIRTGFAQNIAELPIYSGLTERLIIYAAIVISTILYIFWYANRIKKDPSKSILGENPFPKLDEKANTEVSPNMTLTQKLVIGFLLIGILIYVYGAFFYEWGTDELSGIFIMIAIGTAIISRMGSNAFIKEFIEGCKKILYGALIIGLANAIVVILKDANVLDTIVQGIYLFTKSFSNVAGAIVMLFINGLFNFIISSGTAHAAIIMPIMTPLADLMDIPRQVAVQAYTMGDGFTNIINPLSGTMMAILAISGIPLTKWFRFAVPLVLIWFVLGIIFIVFAVVLNWGPM